MAGEPLAVASLGARRFSSGYASGPALASGDCGRFGRDRTLCRPIPGEWPNSTERKADVPGCRQETVPRQAEVNSKRRFYSSGNSPSCIKASRTATKSASLMASTWIVTRPTSLFADRIAPSHSKWSLQLSDRGWNSRTTSPVAGCLPAMFGLYAGCSGDTPARGCRRRLHHRAGGR